MDQVKVGDVVSVGDQTMTIVAKVRADDDPRKCAPAGFRLRLKRDPRPRTRVTYLAASASSRDLRWIGGDERPVFARCSQG